jgi:hypothetical protein
MGKVPRESVIRPKFPSAARTPAQAKSFFSDALKLPVTGLNTHQGTSELHANSIGQWPFP